MIAALVAAVGVSARSHIRHWRAAAPNIRATQQFSEIDRRVFPAIGVNVFCKMWESRICNPTNNITGNTTYISTNIPVSIHLQAGFLLREGEKNHVFCVSLQSQRKGGKEAMGDAAGGLPVM